MHKHPHRSRRRFLATAAAGAGAAALGLPAIRKARAAVRLRYYSWVPRNSLVARAMGNCAELAARESKGELVVDWGGSAEATPPFQAADAIVSGLYELGHLANSLYASAMPEAICLSATSASAAKLRESGALDVYAATMKSRNGMVFLGMPISGIGYTFLTTAPIKTLADFRGRKLRSLPLYDPLIRALGATPATIAPAEVFTALENGVVDGLGWSDNGIVEFRYHERTKFRLLPTFYGARTALVASPVAWARLTPDQQQALTRAGRALELEAERLYAAEHANEHKQLAQLGMKTETLAPAEATQFLALADQTMWERILKASPQNGAKLKEAFDRAAKA
ncbi:MAG: TRAP transporter substrate-binding protein DctP [Alphaproteobacteria bacterium]